jgi:hypothetical protein
MAGKNSQTILRNQQRENRNGRQHCGGNLIAQDITAQKIFCLNDAEKTEQQNFEVKQMIYMLRQQRKNQLCRAVKIFASKERTL